MKQRIVAVILITLGLAHPAAAVVFCFRTHWHLTASAFGAMLYLMGIGYMLTFEGIRVAVWKVC